MPPAQQLGHLGQAVGVLEQRVGERGDHALVHREQRRQLAVLDPVLALEVDDLDGAGGGDLVHQLRRPRRRDVELEAQAGVQLEPAADRVERRRVAEPERVHEPHRPRLGTDDLVQRAAGLVEREVERRRLERPVAPAPRGVPVGRHRPLVDLGAGGRRTTPASSRRPAAATGLVTCSVSSSVSKDDTSSPTPSAPPPLSRTQRRDALEAVRHRRGRGARTRSRRPAAAARGAAPRGS